MSYLFIILFVLLILLIGSIHISEMHTFYFNEPMFQNGLILTKKVFDLDTEIFKKLENKETKLANLTFKKKENRILFRRNPETRDLILNKMFKYRGVVYIKSDNTVEVVGRISIYTLILQFIVIITLLAIFTIDLLNNASNEYLSLFLAFIFTVTLFWTYNNVKERFESQTNSLLRYLKNKN